MTKTEIETIKKQLESGEYLTPEKLSQALDFALDEIEKEEKK